MSCASLRATLGLFLVVGSTAAVAGNSNDAIARRPDGLGHDVAVALDASDKAITVKGLPFKINKVLSRQQRLDADPWRGEGGDWTFVDAELAGGSFYLAFQAHPAPNAMPAYETGDGVLIFRDTASAQKILSAVASYLHIGHERVAKTLKGPRPLPLRMGIFGRGLNRNANGSFTRQDRATWTCAKLTIELRVPEVYAEVYFNFDPTRLRGEFSEKEPEFRRDVFNALSWAAGL